MAARTIYIQTAKGVRAVRPESIRKGLALHARVGEPGWAVTHVLSGLRLPIPNGQVITKLQAMKLRNNALRSGLDWARASVTDIHKAFKGQQDRIDALMKGVL
jgi:hypothetical protein